MSNPKAPAPHLSQVEREIKRERERELIIWDRLYKNLNDYDKLEQSLHNLKTNEYRKQILNIVAAAPPILLSLDRGCEDCGCADEGTLLHFAINENAPFECIELLLKAGADPTIQDSDGYTPLERAVKRNNYDIVRIKEVLDARIKEVLDARMPGGSRKHRTKRTKTRARIPGGSRKHRTKRTKTRRSEYIK